MTRSDPLLNPQKPNNPHVWGSPIPGQGNARVCTACGIRRTAASDATDCPHNVPKFATAPADEKPDEADHHYEPLP